MKTAWFVGGKFLGEFDSPGTYENSHTRYACLYCGEFFAQVIATDNPQGYWYVQHGNCGCKKFLPTETPPHVPRGLWRWDWEVNPPPKELLVEEFILLMNQIDWSQYGRHSENTY